MGTVITRAKTMVSRWAAGGFVPVPVSWWEWLLMRIGFAGVVFHTFQEPHPFRYEGQPFPVGLAKIMDLSFLNAPHMHELFWWSALVCCLGYISGWGLRLWLPLLTVGLTMVRSYANSQGAVHHGFQLVALCLLAQTMVVWWWHWPGRKRREGETGLSLPSYLLYYTSGVIAFSYVVSAITKILNSRGLWIWNSRYISVEIVKSQRLMALGSTEGDVLQKVDIGIARWLIDHPWVATVVFGSGFILELFAFIALRDRAWAFFIGVSLIAFHFGVQWLMGLTFHYHTLLELIFLVNIPFWTAYIVRLAFPKPLR